jgi:hypothetical protein
MRELGSWEVVDWVVSAVIERVAFTVETPGVVFFPREK